VPDRPAVDLRARRPPVCRARGGRRQPSSTRPIVAACTGRVRFRQAIMTIPDQRNERLNFIRDITPVAGIVRTGLSRHRKKQGGKDRQAIVAPTSVLSPEPLAACAHRIRFVE
jgi:hypothetical protein